MSGLSPCIKYNWKMDYYYFLNYDCVSSLDLGQIIVHITSQSHVSDNVKEIIGEGMKESGRIPWMVDCELTHDLGQIIVYVPRITDQFLNMYIYSI